MKKTAFLVLFLGFIFFAKAQFFISGTVFDQKNNPVPFAVVKISPAELSTTTDENGKFKFENLAEGTYVLKVVANEFLIKKDTIHLKNNMYVKIQLEPDPSIELEEVIVSATRANNDIPIAFSTMEKPTIEKMNLGQDIPYVLKIMPSVTMTSDAGTGIGYTQLWIRGTDLTRINVTLNGIPLNDAESHGVWWVDIPDFLSSVDNIQIQRGVGTSTNGAAAFGASINLKTTKINKIPYSVISTSYGSFNTFKSTVKIGSGLLNNHFSFDLRLSKIHSDGYIDRAWANMKSFYFSGAYTTKDFLLNAIIFSGFEETYQAWYGVPKDSLPFNRTYNPYTYENEIDHYVQTHFQLFAVKKFFDKLTLELGLHYTKGAGYYEQFKSDKDFSDYFLDPIVFGNDTIFSSDFIQRKWLDNDFKGLVFSLNFKNSFLNSTLGGGYNVYDGLHFGRILWYQYNNNYPYQYEWYNNEGLKIDRNIYWKNTITLFSKLKLFADLQYRQIFYMLSGIFDDYGEAKNHFQYNFFNPKGGFIFNFNKKQNIYASFGIANREPKRSDYIDRLNDPPNPEKLYDYEAGYKYNSSNLLFNVNFYYMNYKDQLVFTGEINDVGAPIMVNVPKSYRRGVEIIWGTKFKKFEWNANLTLSQNKILDFTAYVDNWDYWSDPYTQPLQYKEYYKITDIAFSPSVIASSLLIFNINKNLSLDLVSKYVGRQYIDNTSNIERSLDPYFVNDLRIRFDLKNKIFKKLTFALQINNIFNEEYETFAWVYRYYYNGEEYEMNGYFPQAPRNYLFNITVNF